MIKLKRIYEAWSPRDGYRVSVDRLWARGMTKEEAHIDLWLKEIAPSTPLRKWFTHEPEKWQEFRSRFRSELKENPAAKTLRELMNKRPAMTLLSGARDETFSHARIIKEWIEKK